MGMILWCALILLGSSIMKFRKSGKTQWASFLAYWFVLISACLLGYLNFKYLSEYLMDFTNHWGVRWFIQTFVIFTIEALLIVAVMCLIDKTWWPVIRKMFGRK